MKIEVLLGPVCDLCYEEYGDSASRLLLTQKLIFSNRLRNSMPKLAHPCITAMLELQKCPTMWVFLGPF